MNQIHKAKLHLPILIDHCEQLKNLTKKIMNSVEVKNNEDFPFMVFCFLGIEYENLIDIISLCKNKRFTSAAIVARASMEAMVLMLWAASDPAIRARKWREYSVIEDYIRLKEMKEHGDNIDNAGFKKAETECQNIYKQFLKKNNSSHKKFDKLGRYDFAKNWYDDKTVSSIFRDVKGEDLYRICYSNSSKIIHSSPIGIARRIRKENNALYLSCEECFDIGAEALTVGFQSLIQVLELFNKHLRLSFAQYIDDVKANWRKALDNA